MDRNGKNYRKTNTACFIFLLLASNIKICVFNLEYLYNLQNQKGAIVPRNLKEGAGIEEVI